MRAILDFRWFTCALVIGAAVAPGAQPTTQELMDRINSLQAEVNQLKTAQQQQQTSDAAQTQATIESVQADAERNSRLVDLQSFTAGYRSERGFMLQGEDGRYMLHPWLLFQFRNETTYREDGKSGGRSDVQNGFEVRRLKLGLDGNLFGPDLTYQFIVVGFAR